MIDKPDSHYSQILDFDHARSEPVVSPARSFPWIPDYEVLRHIGAGMFGDVWLVRNELDHGYYAMKTLHEGIGIELEAIREFKRRVAESPYIVPIGHVGDYRGLIYYIMPLADNALPDRGVVMVDDYEPMTLAEYVRRNGKMSASKVIDVASCVLQGLDAMHTAGAIHRDVKAENIMQFDGAWRLADPGLMTTLYGDDVADRFSEDASSDTHLDIKAAAMTLERIYDLSEEPGASKHLLMASLGRAKLEEIDPNRYQSAQQMLASVMRAKSKPNAFSIPLLIASHCVVACVAILAGWLLALAPDGSASEQLYDFSQATFDTQGTCFNDVLPIENGETIYDVGYNEIGAFVKTNVYVDADAKYELSTRAFYGCQRGIIALSVDGEQLGDPFDMYAPKCHDKFVTVYHGRLELEEGWHTLKYELVSSNEKAEVTNGAFVNLRMTPVD